jgi:acetyltransferase-like isoleucine patch superfamily enzyme
MSYPLATKVRNRARDILMALRIGYLRRVYGMNIGKGCKIALSVKMDKTNPAGMQVGEYTGIAMRSIVLAHDFLNNRHITTRIGSCCHIGASCIIMPGVEIGDHVIVGPGSVVTRSIPSNSIAFGNPARVMEKGIETGRWGILKRPDKEEGANEIE